MSLITDVRNLERRLRETPKVAANAILHDWSTNKVLLGLRAKDDPALPGLWATPGGGVEFRETIDDAIVRECMEEVGCKVFVDDDFLSVQESFREGKHHILIFKRAGLKCGSRTPRPLDGFDDVQWFGWTDISNGLRDQITPLTFAALSAYYKQFFKENL